MQEPLGPDAPGVAMKTHLQQRPGGASIPDRREREPALVSRRPWSGGARPSLHARFGATLPGCSTSATAPYGMTDAQIAKK